MKRARVIAAAVPAAFGLAIPVAAGAATTTHQAPRGHSDWLRTAYHCLGGYSPLRDYSVSCFGLIGNQNWVSRVEDYRWASPGVAYVGYQDVPGYPAKSKWRDTRMTSHSHLGWYRNWYPNCSFPTGTLVYGWISYDRTHINTSIHGSDFTGRHKCA